MQMMKIFKKNEKKDELKLLVYELTTSLKELSVNISPYRDHWLDAEDPEVDHSIRRLVSDVQKLNHFIEQLED
jgi:hypothetical protein